MTFIELLKKKRIKQNDLASKLGISQASISYWVTGKNNPSLAMIQKIANVMDCELDKVLECFIKNKEKEE